MIGFVLVIAATFGRSWCAVYISGRKNKELCQLGPYSLCRNPLYFFSFLGMIGILAAAQNMILILIMIPIFLIYYHFVINSEEKRLIEIFNGDFEEYRRKVNRVIPSFREYRNTDKIEINPKRIFREMSEAMLFVLLLIPIEIIVFLKDIDLIPVLWHLPF
jgi:hypothetical protein